MASFPLLHSVHSYSGAECNTGSKGHGEGVGGFREPNNGGLVLLNRFNRTLTPQLILSYPRDSSIAMAATSSPAQQRGSLSASYSIATRSSNPTSTTPNTTSMLMDKPTMWSRSRQSSNFGPNTATFIIPARSRTKCHGISGAAGKVGAIDGSIGFLWASDKDKRSIEIEGSGMMGSLIASAATSLLGALVTYLFTPETNGRSLEENETENPNGNGLVHSPEVQLPA